MVDRLSPSRSPETKMKRGIDDILTELRSDPRFVQGIRAWRHLPPSPGDYREIPDDIFPALKQALTAMGIEKLYSHQLETWNLVRSGRNVVVLTPTASGKTLCYNLPVLDTILKDPSARALYLFPTKALAQDQLDELNELKLKGGFELKSFTYDGDTPGHLRRLAREVGQVIVTNPDMLHQGILPHHPRWVGLFQSLRFVVIDEIHNYRGVFGAHVANVLRRLQRICRFYRSSPIFILASATIANPAELARSLTGMDFAVVDKSGAPLGEKDFVFYNPPALSPDGSIRQSAIAAATRLASRFVKEGIQTIVFARSRISVELLVQYLRDSHPLRTERERIQGYRGGYLPNERRAIEKALREGEILGVAATNALELGIDIGSLDCAILAGYPGTIASTWQQAGRAGRRKGKSVAFLVAGQSPLDQFIINHPDYFFSQPPEYALVNPDNRYIMGEHVKCAAFELPFTDGESFGGNDVSEILEELERSGILHHSGGRWHWSNQSFPAESVSLRSATNENFVVVDVSSGNQVIGEVDWSSAPLLIHDEAIYMHRGQQYHVLKLDYAAQKAYVKKVNVDYYTDANLAVSVRVISKDAEKTEGGFSAGFGELSVTAIATIFKKIKFYTQENVGSGQIHLPEMTMHTQGMWVSLPEEVLGEASPDEIGEVLSGLGHLLVNIAPLFLMCDPQDLGVAVEVRSLLDGSPTVYIYDAYPGGVGLSERAFALSRYILAACYEATRSCPCTEGCPGCVGPRNAAGKNVKHLVMKALSSLELPSLEDGKVCDGSEDH